MGTFNDDAVERLTDAVKQLNDTVESITSDSFEHPLVMIRNNEGLLVPADEKDFTEDVEVSVDTVTNKMTKAQILEKYNKLANQYRNVNLRHRRFMKLFGTLEHRSTELAKDVMSRPSRSEYDALSSEYKSLKVKYESLHSAYVRANNAVLSRPEEDDLISVRKSDLENISIALLSAENKPSGHMLIAVRRIRSMIRQIIRDGEIHFTRSRRSSR